MAVANRLNRAGLTRLELGIALVVVGLLAVNSATFLPQIRDTARRRQCAYNLSHLGRALATYHDTFVSLPPAAFATPGKIKDLHGVQRNKDLVNSTYANWVGLLLPHLGLMNVYEMYDRHLPAADLRNQAACNIDLPAMTCPTDDYNVPANHFVLHTAGTPPPTFARGDYAINGGTHNMHSGFGTMSAPIVHATQFACNESTREFWIAGNGVAGFNKSFSYSDITNGLSTTVAIDEIRAGIHPIDPRGVWALGQVGSSITWQLGLGGDAVGPNNTWYGSDDIPGCEKLTALVSEAKLVSERMGCVPYIDRPVQAGARSKHIGGAHVLMLDGVVRFVSDDVDRGVWHLIHGRETPRHILEGEDLATLLITPQTHQQAANPNTASHESAVPPAKAQETLFVNSLNMKMVRVRAGEFTMGLPDEGEEEGIHPNVSPPHRVRITKDFYLGAYEVTQDEFVRVMKRNPSAHSKDGLFKDKIRGKETAQYPVENVTWTEAQEFCEKLSNDPAEKQLGRVYRLPTEAEWELACRGGSNEPYKWSKQRRPDDHSGEAAGIQPALPLTPVGSYPPNAFGFFDMRGNVWEWCGDWYSPDYYAWSRIEDPAGPKSGYLKVVRGNCWAFVDDSCHLALQVSVPWTRFPYLGFRVACDGR